MGTVTVIPSTKNPLTQLPLGGGVTKKVAAYARVSTNSDEQYTSYEAQVNYYRKYIQERPEWEFANVYADEGITGTSTKKRVEFNKMISNALSGKIDLIITKSISRFARNTLDTISYVRKLKDHGVEVFFEKENLWTLDPKSELILTIMASIAQEESRSISQNVTWGKRVGFQAGKVSFAYKSFLGYKKEGDKIVIDEDQAVIVRLIYRMFLVEGKTCSGIANHLKSLKIETPSGKSSNWSKNTVNSILTNEKYKGDALLQKTFTDNYLEHSLKKNTGQVPQYYVENNHPAIIEREMWEQVQLELERRNELGAKYSSVDVFASKLVCEDCGGFYGKKIWHSTSKYAKSVYQCNNKFHANKQKCQTPNLTEEEIKQKFLDAYNIGMEDRKRVIQDTTETINLLTDTRQTDEDIDTLNAELLVIGEMVSKLVKENSKSGLGLDEYNRKYDELSKRYELTKARLNASLELKSEKIGRALKMKTFLSNLTQSSEKLSDWNVNVWMLMVERAIIHRDSSITFVIYNGSEVRSS